MIVSWEAIYLNTKIFIGDTVIRCREENFGYYTIFDGNVSIQVNSTFYYILSCISEKLEVEEIIEKISKKFEKEKIETERIRKDVEYVINFVKDKGWI